MRRSNSSRVRNQYWTPSSSPRPSARVVAETASASSGNRGSTSSISVPLPAPDGPVTTKTGFAATTGASTMVEEVNQLVALAVGQTADRLRLADAALVEQTRSLHAAELGDRHQHVEDLCGRNELGRLAQDLLDGDGA